MRLRDVRQSIIRHGGHGIGIDLLMPTAADNQHHCHRCDKADRCCLPAMPCTADVLKRDIIVLSAEGCPIQKFPAADGQPEQPAERHTIPLAGDLLEAALKRVGAGRLTKLYERARGKGCGCTKRKERLNRIDRRIRKWLGASSAA